MTLPDTEAARRRVLQDMSGHLREETLRIILAEPLRFTEIKDRLLISHADRPLLDGQITRVLASLRQLGYAQKAPGRQSPWSVTDRGKQAITMMDRAVRPPAPAGTTSLPSAATNPEKLLRGGRMDRLAEIGIDPTRAHPARRYDYLLGGKNNFEADRISAEEFIKVLPTARESARENRDFLGRAVRFLAAQAGIRQFLDVGPGLPTVNNTHEVAQLVAPDSRIVYADNDPMVLRHAQALLNSNPQGATAFIHADLREPEAILGRPELHDTLDLSKPVGLVLVAVLHFVHGDGVAQQIVERLLNALPPGSYLVASHFTLDYSPPEVRQGHLAYVKAGKTDVWPRSRTDFTSLFDGLELADPGIVPVSEWRRPFDQETAPPPKDIGILGAVGRKP